MEGDEDSLEAQLDAALRDLESDEEGEPAADTSRTHSVAEELDFGQGQADDDGFEEERAKEREQAIHTRQENTSTGLGQGQGPIGTNLADRLLKAGRSTGQTKDDASVRKLGIACRALRWTGALVVMLTLIKTSGTTKKFLTGDNSMATSCSLATSTGAAVAMASEGKLMQASGRVWVDAKSQGGTRAVVFRGFGASKAQVDRILTAAAEIRNMSTEDSEAVDVWVSLDNTHSHNATHLFITELEKFKPRLILGRDLKLHQYTEKDVQRLYPAVAPPVAKKVDTKKRKRRPVLPKSTVFSVESTLAWYWHPKVPSESYEAVWVVDVDAAFSGHWRALLSAYAEDDSDLLSPHCSQQSPAASAQKKETPIQETSFEKYVGDQVRSPSPTFVQRFSSRLLLELGDCSTRGIVAAENVAVCSLAMRSGMEVRMLEPEHLGTFKDDGTEVAISAKLLEAERAQQKGSGSGKFYHPVE